MTKTLIAAVVASAFSIGAFAQSTAASAPMTKSMDKMEKPMAKDNMKKDDMKKDHMSKDDMKKDHMKKDEMKKDGMMKKGASAPAA